jgi:hypothetical protein
MEHLFVMYTICQSDEKFQMETVLNLLTEDLYHRTVGSAAVRCVCVTEKLKSVTIYSWQ